MPSTSINELAVALVACCLRDRTWPPALLDSLVSTALDADPNIAQGGSNALFGTVVERLADLFDPDLCTVYAGLFSNVISRVIPELDPEELIGRYNRVRKVRRFSGDAASIRKVFVLSRITLGADVAVTSVIMDAARQRFPEAEILFVGPRKNWEMFGADARIGHLPVSYGRRGNLADRLALWEDLQGVLTQPDSIVIDPDSRLTQLGLLPVCPEENYYFFESRAFDRESSQALPVLTRRWVEATFGVPEAKAFLAPVEAPDAGALPLITVSLGVGENPAKRIPDPFEQNLLRGLVRPDMVVWIDKGAGGEETERVERAIALCGAAAGQIRTWDGAFAPFASLIARSRLYVGYDSAGQHVAAACGVPLLTVFAGSVSTRMFERWSPSGPGPIQVVRVQEPNPDKVLVEALSAVYRLGA